MKYRIEVHYMSNILKKVEELMSQLDDNVRLYAIKEIMTMTSEKDLSISEIKDKIIDAIQLCDCEVVHIEGGLVE